MQVSSRWLKLCCSLEFGDCGIAVRVQAQDTSEGTVCFRIVWSNSHSLACLREIGSQAQGSAELCDCWIELPLIQQNPAQRVVRFRTLGCELHHFFESRTCGGKISLLQRRHSALVN